MNHIIKFNTEKLAMYFGSSKEFWVYHRNETGTVVIDLCRSHLEKNGVEVELSKYTNIKDNNLYLVGTVRNFPGGSKDYRTDEVVCVFAKDEMDARKIYNTINTDYALESLESVEVIAKINTVTIVTLCGSHNFLKEFKEVERYLIGQHKVVLTPSIFNVDNFESLTEKEHEFYDITHREKIDISDEVFIIDKDGYIGKDTKEEIEYAKSKGKIIKYYSKESFFDEDVFYGGKTFGK